MVKFSVSTSISSKVASVLSNSSVGRKTRFTSAFSTLENGLGLSVVSFPGIKTVSFRGFVFVGSVYEPREINGISHFLEHMLFRGNEKLGDAATMSIKMEELGGEFNAATSFDQTEYWLDIHRDFLEKGIERFCQFLQFPVFDQLEIERSIILEEIISDYNEENSLIDLDSLSSNALWPDHAMGMPIIGTPKTIKAIQKTDLIAWHRKFYSPSNMMIGITGDVDASWVKKKIAEQFGDAKLEKMVERYEPITVKPLTENQLILVNDKDNQFSLQWSFPVAGLSKESRVEHELIRRILDGGNSSRLQRLIREEKGLVYDISLDTTYFSEGVAVSLQSVVGIRKLDELISALVDLIGELIEKGVTQAELEMAKLRFKAALECNNDTAQGLLYDTLMPFLNPAGATFEETLPLLQSLPLERINRTLKQLLRQSGTTFVLVGPWDEETRQTLSAKLYPWISGKNIS